MSDMDNSQEKENYRQPPESTKGIYSSQVERKGVWMVPTFWDFEHELDELEIKPGDVWIVSFPKSGTTWMQEMVWLLTHNLDFEGAKTLLKYRSPGIESTWIKRFYNVPGDTLDDFKRWASMSGGRRILKTHLQYNILPKNLRQENTPGKIIYVARNPKDVCVSLYYFYHLYERYHQYNITLDDFYQNFMWGKYMCGPYWRHVKQYWSRRNNKDILFVKYEDMKKNLERVICEVATFLEEPVPNQEQMKQLVHHLSFDSMKKNPALNREQGEDKLRNDKDPHDGCFIRKGIIGSWKEKMTPERAKEFDEWIEDNLKGTDLTFEDS